ncbi:MAG: methionine--tRNA ligase [Phycisphaerae bacterium]|nr:methionine--tRNA ligase [Tepidisphaeraceae bacterium]
MPKPFYITTPIYYPNGEPHLGHAYTTLAADVIARYHRLAGDDTFFLTGTDEHGIKMVKTAAEKGVTPQQLADQNVKIFEDLWKELKVENDDFIRTSSDRHKTAVQEIVRRLTATGDIYLGAYEGWYDEGQEEFVTETAAKDQEFKSAVSGRPLVRYSESTYFFKLTKYTDRVRQAIESDQILVRPESRKNEVLSKLKQGVNDLSISRATLTWGIPMPQDPGHVLYVWIDALSNYVTALGYPTSWQTVDNQGPDRFAKYWPADVHLIGKEILWFHVVYWPAMLMALGVDCPKQVFAHGWWTAEGKKMSKSMGNFIDVERLRSEIKKYGLDTLQFYLLRAAPFGSDLDWKEAELASAHNELANVVGNCLNRSLNITNKNRDAILPAAGELQDLDRALLEKVEKLPADLAAAYEKLELQQAALLPVELARATNGYIDATAPWKLAKDPAQAERLNTVLNVATRAIYASLVGLLPILPEKAAEGLKQLAVETAGKSLSDLFAYPPNAGHWVGVGSPLFPKAE